MDEEVICNRCGFGSDELDEGEIASEWFAQLAHEMYCNGCIAEHMAGDWVPAKPDDSVPTLENNGIVFASGGWCTPANQVYNLYSYTPMYFEQKKKRLQDVLADVRKHLGN